MIGKLLGVLKVATSIQNLKSKSTKVAAGATAAAVAAPEVLPPDSVEAAVVQVVCGLIALYGFFKGCNK